MKKRKLKKINWKILIISLVIVYSVAFIGSLFTSQSTSSTWYQQIKPSITPPNWIFPIVWNILFLLIGLSLYLSWISSNIKEKQKVAIAFGINFVLNILWSILYFGFRNTLFAFYEIIFLIISIASMIYVTYKIDKKSAYLLIPYLLWVCFASILNFLSI